MPSASRVNIQTGSKDTLPSDTRSSTPWSLSSSASTPDWANPTAARAWMSTGCPRPLFRGTAMAPPLASRPRFSREPSVSTTSAVNPCSCRYRAYRSAWRW